MTSFIESLAILFGITLWYLNVCIHIFLTISLHHLKCLDVRNETCPNTTRINRYTEYFNSNHIHVKSSPAKLTVPSGYCLGAIFPAISAKRFNTDRNFSITDIETVNVRMTPNFEISENSCQSEQKFLILERVFCKHNVAYWDPTLVGIAGKKQSFTTTFDVSGQFLHTISI